ncbi:hypothetical protein [Streptomyces sp. XY332]|uniref:hypothetical protein n=1 Tax=Streptomyces sp. XY332 TaxID=1415561 RepID=UPI00131B939F|nr:hypothetical protein [Streptomyces sp. XY332]
MHAALPIDLLIGPYRAAQFITDCVTELITEDCIPAPAAYDAVRRAVLESDPFVLAETGQAWALRPGTHDDNGSDGPREHEERPGMLYVVRRLRTPSMRTFTEPLHMARRDLLRGRRRTGGGRRRGRGPSLFFTPQHSAGVDRHCGAVARQ